MSNRFNALNELSEKKSMNIFNNYYGK